MKITRLIVIKVHWTEVNGEESSVRIKQGSTRSDESKKV